MLGQKRVRPYFKNKLGMVAPSYLGGIGGRIKV
jgi:hypothetical protein